MRTLRHISRRFHQPAKCKMIHDLRRNSQNTDHCDKVIDDIGVRQQLFQHSKPSCFIFSHNISLSDDGMDCVCAHYSPSFPACPHKPFYIFLHPDFHSREKSTGTVPCLRDFSGSDFLNIITLPRLSHFSSQDVQNCRFHADKPEKWHTKICISDSDLL